MRTGRVLLKAGGHRVWAPSSASFSTSILRLNNIEGNMRLRLRMHAGIRILYIFYFFNFYISHIQAGIVAGEDVSQRARQRWLATSCGVLVKSSEFLSSPLAIFLSTALSRRRIFLSSSQGTWSSSWRRAARQSPPPPPTPTLPTHPLPTLPRYIFYILSTPL